MGTNGSSCKWLESVPLLGCHERHHDVLMVFGIPDGTFGWHPGVHRRSAPAFLFTRLAPWLATNLLCASRAAMLAISKDDVILLEQGSCVGTIQEPTLNKQAFRVSMLRILGRFVSRSPTSCLLCCRFARWPSPLVERGPNHAALPASCYMNCGVDEDIGMSSSAGPMPKRYYPL